MADFISKLFVGCHLTHIPVEAFEVHLSEKKHLDGVPNPYRVLSLGGVDFYLTDEQIEKMISSIEQTLYDESYWRSFLEKNLIAAEVKIEALEDRVMELEETIEILKYRNGRAI